MDLSVLIPARGEEFLLETINDVLAHSEAETEIVVVLDGGWPLRPIPDHPQVTLVHYPEPIGQRAAINRAARVATGRYVMKLDAHCAVGPGFDRILLEDMQPGWTVVPKMYNLHVFDWSCRQCGQRTYQGSTPEACPGCGSAEFEKAMVWQAKPSPETTAMGFDRELRFQYWGDLKKRQGAADLVETMSILGACFMLERERFFELNICDEKHGSWGQQGTEVACATWLSGGKLICNKRTWFAHMFRTQGGDFGFPYPLTGREVDRAREYSRELWLGNNHPRQIYPLAWLVERFWPVQGWDEADLERVRKKAEGFRKRPTQGIVYYTDNRLDAGLMAACQAQLGRAAAGRPLVSVSLGPLSFGQNISLDLERGYLTMFRQILAGLEASRAEIIFLAEHDILYHPSHFDFTPPDPNRIYYNTNVWHLRASDGHTLYYTAKRLSQLCAYRDVLIEHYRRRVRLVEESGFSRKMGFEPGSHNRAERVDDLQSDTWRSAWPNIDIKHGQNLTQARWSQEQFRDKRNCQDWLEGDGVPGWGVTQGRFEAFLAALPGRQS